VTHYAAYSVVYPLGLRVITLNTDLYFKGNPFLFLHYDDPDYSGMFSFLIDELQKAEGLGQMAWIIGHTHGGWDGWNSLPAASDLLQQIIEIYSLMSSPICFGAIAMKVSTLACKEPLETNPLCLQTRPSSTIKTTARPRQHPTPSLPAGLASPYHHTKTSTQGGACTKSTPALGRSLTYTFIANVSTFDSLN
jgi:hypothetical protein